MWAQRPVRSMGVHIDATWRIRVNNPCAAAMLHRVKFLRPFVVADAECDDYDSNEGGLFRRHTQLRW